MNSAIDIHVNILPPFAREFIPEDLSTESDALRRAYFLAGASKYHERCSPDSILQDMADANVRSGLCFSYNWKSMDLCRMCNDYTMDMVEQYQGRLYGLAVVQPRDTAACDELNRCMEKKGMLGLKIKPRWCGVSLSDQRLLGPLCEVLREKGGMLLTHVSQNFMRGTGDSLFDLVEFLKFAPDIPVVAAHMGAFIEMYNRHPPVARVMENLFIDVSLHDNLHWLPCLMRTGNPDRYIYGTDYPYLDYDLLDAKLRGLELTDAEMERLCVENPKRLSRRVRAWRSLLEDSKQK